MRSRPYSRLSQTAGLGLMGMLTSPFGSLRAAAIMQGLSDGAASTPQKRKAKQQFGQGRSDGTNHAEKRAKNKAARVSRKRNRPVKHSRRSQNCWAA
jgi:hypothetical protein